MVPMRVAKLSLGSEQVMCIVLLESCSISSVFFSCCLSDIAFFTSLIVVILSCQCSCSGVRMLKQCVSNNHVTYCTELNQLQPYAIGMAKSNFTYSYESISDSYCVQRE